MLVTSLRCDPPHHLSYWHHPFEHSNPYRCMGIHIMQIIFKSALVQAVVECHRLICFFDEVKLSYVVRTDSVTKVIGTQWLRVCYMLYLDNHQLLLHTCDNYTRS